MTVVTLLFIFCFVITSSCPWGQSSFWCSGGIISFSHTVKLWSMGKHRHKSCIFSPKIIRPALFSECWCVRWWFFFHFVCVSVCFLQYKRFFFYLALALPQDFSFSVLCLALNACICFGVVFSGWSSAQFCFSTNFLYIHHCCEVIVMWKPTSTCVLWLSLVYFLVLKFLLFSC